MIVKVTTSSRYGVMHTSMAIAALIFSMGTTFAQQDTTKIKSDTVLVTVGRVSEEIREIPLAITVVPQVSLQTQRGFGLDQALTLVPGVVAQSRTGGNDVRIQVRGFGARGSGQRSNAGTSRGVRYYQDGIPETEPDGRTSFDLLNMVHASRIEVIRSNASALWGNASGGVIMLSSVPATTEPLINASSAVGSFGFMQNALLANTPLGNGQAYVSINNTSMDGWRAHSASSLVQGTVGFVLHPSNRTNVGIFATAASNVYRIPGALTKEQYEANPQQAQTNPAVYNPTYTLRDEMRNNKLGRIGATFDHAFDNSNGLMGTMYVQSKALERSERNTWRDFTRYHTGGNAVYRNTTAVGQNSLFKVLLGTDLQYQDGAILFYSLDTATKSRGTELRDNKREGALDVGGFVQAEYMTEEFSLIGGLRFDAISYFYENRIVPTINSDKTFQQVIPKLGATYKLNEGASIYANLGGGIEVPAGNETDPPSVRGEDTITSINPLLEPIRSTTYELGIKGAEGFESFFASVTYDAALFFIDVKNDIVPYRNGRFYMTAGHSTRIGAELGFAVKTNIHLSLYGALSIMKSEYKTYAIDSGFIDTTVAGHTTSYAGNSMPGIPPMSSTLRLRYDSPDYTGLFAEIEWRNISGYYADDANALQVDAMQTIDVATGGTIEIVSKFLNCTAMIRVNNVLNSTYMASAWINPDNTAGGIPYIESGLPRNITGSIYLKFTP
ncbi:MAG: TonB-dependent receptor [Ignavibacteria bacterium]|nr:TonB-dependent receptor [Ignavibacteria bacterium]